MNPGKAGDFFTDQRCRDDFRMERDRHPAASKAGAGAHEAGWHRGHMIIECSVPDRMDLFRFILPGIFFCRICGKSLQGE
jgi:hypothetical protein